MPSYRAMPKSEDLPYALYSASQVMRLDRLAIEQFGIPGEVLMKRAGAAAFALLRDQWPDAKHIAVLAGTGNNGGDALVAAHYLHEWGARVTVCLCSRREDNDENLHLLYEKGIACINTYDSGIESIKEPLTGADCVIDGLLGTGRMRPLEGLFRDIMEMVKAERSERGCCVIAVDLPTGMDADTGACDPACCPAKPSPK